MKRIVGLVFLLVLIPVSVSAEMMFSTGQLKGDHQVVGVVSSTVEVRERSIGEVRYVQELVNRALSQLKEEARSFEAVAVEDVRLLFVPVSNEGGSGCIVAYGTALR